MARGVSTAQHAADLAVAASDAGHQVTVITGARGYDNPLQSYPRRETWKGVRVLRGGFDGNCRGFDVTEQEFARRIGSSG